jgi:hypothetical protein
MTAIDKVFKLYHKAMKRVATVKPSKDGMSFLAAAEYAAGVSECLAILVLSDDERYAAPSRAAKKKEKK